MEDSRDSSVADGMLKDHTSSDKMIRVAIRSVCLLTMIEYTLELFSQSYFHLVSREGIGKLLVGWYVLSSFLLLLVVLVRRSRTGAGSRHQRADRVDLVLVSLWAVYFWGSFFYALGHYGTI